MKRMMAWGLALLIMAGLCGCAPGGGEAAREATGISVVCSIFPVYDFARTLTKGTDARVELLIKPGVESHSFDPAPSDIVRVQQAALFAYIGGENDAWVDAILDGLDGGTMRPVRLIDSVDTARVEDEHGHAGVDEHIWTSPRNAMRMVQALSDALCAANPHGEVQYRKNERDFIAELEALDADFARTVSEGVRREIAFGDRFPLKYFADCYGLTYISAFPNCASESEPSAAQIAQMISGVKADHLPVVYHLEQGSVRTAEVIAQEAGVKVRLFHACHNVTREELESGATYLSLMRSNVEALREGLS